ncbi:class I SAM-dependent methyltransferase [Amycolatopsis nigrescens]|uniref:class I SAM-dependent methyltransferase n=1 Tax=Amycolatopsis nigrescens TaxID=381445 RepID=UPI00038059D4|nr:class I SAM-dependent methyltransferase [Amycolatopsis nigrescens]
MNATFSTLEGFYLPRSSGESSLFQIWERGEARGDSVTPSTYSAAYRDWMHEKLVAAIKDNETDRLLSLGSGNATLERCIVQDGYRVLAVDAIQEAVDLARSKDVDAVCADVMAWTPDGTWPVIYADGLLGHLYDADRGLAPVFRRIRSWLADGPGGGTFIASNDSPAGTHPAQAAPGVPGFHWLSPGYLRDEALAGGFTEISTDLFHYDRPLSGRRTRAVITANLEPTS